MNLRGLTTETLVPDGVNTSQLVAGLHEHLGRTAHMLEAFDSFAPSSRDDPFAESCLIRSCVERLRQTHQRLELVVADLDRGARLEW